MNRVGTPRTAAVAALLFAFSLAVCLLFVFAYPLPDAKSDAAGYLTLARNVAGGAGFTQDGVSPMVYRPPLFSVLLGAWFRLTGTASVLSAAVFQSVVHALGVAAAFGLFLEILPSLAWAGGAALFLSVNPLLVTRTVFVLQEPTLLLFTTLAAWMTVRLLQLPSPARAALSGAAWGVCTLGKAVAWFAPFLLLAMRFLPVRLRWSWRGKEAAALLFCFAAAIAPWTVRNFLLLDRFVPVNAQGEGMLEWNVKNAEIPGEPSGRRVFDDINRTMHRPEDRRAAFREYIASHPRYFLVDRVIRNAIRFAAPPRDWWIARGDFRPGERRTGFWILAILFHIPLYLFLLVRTWQWGRGRAAPAFGFLLLFYWVYWAEHALVWGDPRFGLAAYPLLVGMVLPLAGPGGRSTGAADRTGG